MSTKKHHKKKGTVLIICNYYLPGYKSGGSLRTIVNMVERLKDKFNFQIITRDHDGDKIPYTSVKINEWYEVEGTKVFYLSQKHINFLKLRKLILECQPDAIYLNSTFSTLSLIVLTLRKLKLIPSLNIILAPEGELSEGALQLKARKKKIFINFAKITGLYKKLIWKATADLEKQEVRNIKGSDGNIFIAPNMPARFFFKDYCQDLKPKKQIGEAKMVFLSRYMRKKNFKWLLENLCEIKGSVRIDIYGPIEDAIYWEESKKVIQTLPENIKVKYKGSISYDKVIEKLFEYHFFILPTLGENFGHVFLEALAAGCPLIISNRTPWLDLKEKEIGWDLPLEKPQKWIEVIDECINFNQVEYTKISANARAFSGKWLSDSKVEESTLKVLEYSLKKI